LLEIEMKASKKTDLSKLNTLFMDMCIPSIFINRIHNCSITDFLDEKTVPYVITKCCDLINDKSFKDFFMSKKTGINKSIYDIFDAEFKQSQKIKSTLTTFQTEYTKFTKMITAMSKY